MRLRAVMAVLVAGYIGACGSAARAQTDPASPPEPDSPPEHAPDAGVPEIEAEPLPAEHVPRLEVSFEPKTGLAVGDLLHLHIDADAPEGDDVTVAQQSFEPFEISDKRARVEPAKNGRQHFIFDLDLLTLESGDVEVPALSLRVVTQDGLVGRVETSPIGFKVRSLLGNEPNAQLKPRTKPVRVMQDDYTLLYVLGGLLGAGLIALMTLLVSRWWQRRERPLPPPPPPRPPWEIAVERLGQLRRRKGRMLEEGQGVQFVDEVSDVVREYLGGTFGFDGLETTTDEMMHLLKHEGARLELQGEVGQFLNRCDLIKFAKAVPDGDEADLVFAKAQDIVRFSMPAAPPARPQEAEA